MTSRTVKMSRPSPAAAARAAPLVARGRWSAALAVARAYLAMMKPGIIWLLLITAVPPMIMAAEGWPGLDLIALTLFGGILTAGGANALNQWFDRDIDAVMLRTAARPLPAGRISPRRGLLWGLSLVVLGEVELALAVHWLAAVWTLAAVAFYVLIYTVWLKRWTPQNIVIGGAAGAIPPLVGWAAVRGSVELAPALLFLIVFFWTPPHFWALALRYREDYARAGVPMLPVVRGEAETKRQIFVYALLLLGVSLLLPVFGEAGVLYLAAALALGLLFVAHAAGLWWGRSQPMALFFHSILYLTLLFLAAAADTLLL